MSPHSESLQTAIWDVSIGELDALALLTWDRCELDVREDLAGGDKSLQIEPVLPV